MWILENDGEVLQKKRIWLRPGKKYLFGRPSKQENGALRRGEYFIENKTVSRKHLTLSVTNVKAGDGSKIHTRTAITLEDEKTKFGTVVNGERISGESRILRDADEFTFQLGKYEHLFRIKWQPIVLSFTFPSKDTKGGKDPLIAVRSQLEEFDIKTIVPYIIDQTTHVVATKRNTAKCLQALINAKYVVDNSFLDALVYAATPGNLDEPESLSPLEEDFDAHWPNPLEHLPPISKEPGQRGDEFFKPDPGRLDVFEGYTFIFCNQRQFDNLQAPITNGGGKALYYTVEMGGTTTADIVRYVKNIAGDERETGELEDGSLGKGVVVVRFPPEKGHEDWSIELQQTVSLELDQRLIEQNEFLDAILANDARRLRRRLPREETPAPDGNDEYSSSRRAPSGNTTTSRANSPPSTQLDARTRTTRSAERRVRPRGAIVSAFKGFEDDYKPSQAARHRKSPMDSIPEYTSQAIDTPAAMEIEADKASKTAVISETQPKNIRKRPLPSAEDDDDIQDVTESLLPAAAAMKRRRVEEEREAKRRGVPVKDTRKSVEPEHKAPLPKRKVHKEIDIQEAVRERREAEDEANRLDEEDLQEVLANMSVEEMKNLAVVEEMDIPERLRPVRRRTGNDNGEGPVDGQASRWDDRWNGRKNFKKFRPQGQGDRARVRRGFQNVIIPLEEAKKTMRGPADEFWLVGEKAQRRAEARQSGEGRHASNLSSGLQQNDQRNQHREEPEPEVDEQQIPAELVMSDHGNAAVVIDVDKPRTTRGQERSATQLTQSSTSRAKRPAPPSTATSSRSAGAKRQRMLSLGGDEDSDSDSDSDELKFRFKRRT